MVRERWVVEREQCFEPGIPLPRQEALLDRSIFVSCLREVTKHSPVCTNSIYGGCPKSTVVSSAEICVPLPSLANFQTLKRQDAEKSLILNPILKARKSRQHLAYR